MKKHSFDLVVWGHGLGGLVSALTLQKRGAKVLLLSKKSTESFDPAYYEFLNGFTLKPVLKRMGFHPTEVNAMPALPVPLQTVILNHRINCYGAEERFKRELNRELPKYAQRILLLFKETSGRLELYQHLFNARAPIPVKGLFAQRQFRKVLLQICDEQLLKTRPLEEELKSFGIGENFARVLEALQLGLCGFVTPWITGARLAHLLNLIRWEGYAAPKGVVSVREMLLSKIKKRGGVVTEFDEVQEFQVQKKRLSGFYLKGTQFEEVACEASIVAGEPRGLIACFSEKRHFNKWKRQVSSLPVLALKAFQFYKISPEGLPIGIEPQGILVPPPRKDKEGERRKVIRAVRYVIHKNQGKEKNEVWLAATGFIRAVDKLPPLEKIKEDIQKAVKIVIPFLEEFLLEEPKNPVIMDLAGSPGDFRQGFVYTSSKPPSLGFLEISPKTPLKNTYVAGDMIFPGLGLDGEIIAGLQVAHLIEKELSIPKNQL